MTVDVCVVLDRCTDRSEDVVARFPGVRRYRVTFGRVGAARDFGIRSALVTSQRSAQLGSTWVLCTDADSAVPPDWLTTHAELAGAGADMVLGTVIPDPNELSLAMLVRWAREHSNADGHGHVYGANFGLTADMYGIVGGFDNVPAHEDALLAAAARGRGANVVATSRSPVLTSARRTGRAPGGFAHYLHTLEHRSVRAEHSQPDSTASAV